MRLHPVLGNLLATAALLRQASPRAFYFSLAANLLVGLVPAALVYMGAQLIERLSQGHPLMAVFPLVLAYILLGGFQDGLAAVSSFVVDTLQDSARMLVKRQINHAVATYADLSIHESPPLRETSVLAARAGERIGDLVAHAYYVCLGGVMMVPVVLLTGAIAWWIPCFMLAGMLPLAVVRMRTERASWDVQRHHAGTFNALDILERVLRQPEFAKDLRMYRMQPRLLDVWRRHYQGYLTSVRRVRVRNALRLMATALFASACLAVPFCAVVAGFGAGRYDLSDFALVLGALLQLKDGLSAIVFNFGDMVGVSCMVEPYRELLAGHGRRAADRAAAAMPACPQARMQMRALCFRYRPDAPLALDHVDLRLDPGETVVLVGDNGSGKTSLLKLVCGLYAPTAGCIEWSTQGRPPRVYGVFQDFACFPLTPLEGLATEDVELAGRCLESVGLGFLRARLDRPLCPEVPDGISLSGGQWQRLAIARAMVHAETADVLVFDEPTAALDPESEAEIMRLILDLAARRSALIASHRLALTRSADRIVVLDRGRVLEQGDHQALMSGNGKYARMFRSQARFYQ